MTTGLGERTALRKFFENCNQTGWHEVLVRSYPSNPDYHGCDPQLSAIQGQISRQSPLRQLPSNRDVERLDELEEVADGLKRVDDRRRANRPLITPPEMLHYYFEIFSVLTDGLHLVTTQSDAVSYLQYSKIREVLEQGDQYNPQMAHILLDPEDIDLPTVGHVQEGNGEFVRTWGETEADRLDSLPEFMAVSPSAAEDLARQADVCCIENEKAHSLQVGWRYLRDHTSGFERRIRCEDGRVLVRLEESPTQEIPDTIPLALPEFELESWGSLKIAFVDGHTVRFVIGEKSWGTFHYAELRMKDQRTGAPNLMWEFLSKMERHNGSLAWSDHDANSNWKKHKQSLSKLLREVFRLDEEPIPWDRATEAYTCRFQIGSA